MGSLVSIKAFLTLAEAMAFCDRNTKLNLFIQCELDGRYHVYNGG